MFPTRTDPDHPGPGQLPPHDALTPRLLAAPLQAALRPQRGSALLALLLATLLVTLLALALPIMLLQVYDRILPQAATGTLSLLALAVGVAVLLEFALRVVRAEVLARLAAAAEARAQAQAMARIAGTSTAAFDAHGNGWYSERLAAIGTLREAWSGPALQAILDLPFAGLYLLAIALIAGQLALAPAVLLVGVLLVGWVAGRRVRRRAERLAAAEERRFNFLFDVLQGLNTLKLLGAEPLLERRYERLQGTTAELRRELTGALAAAQEGGLLFAHLATIGTAAWGCLMVLDGQLTVGGLSACVMLAGRSMQPLLGGIALWVRWQTLADARRRVAELELLPQEARPGLPPLRVHAGAISLSGIRFGPLLGGGHLFDSLSLDVAAGEFLGITGPNGSGRSALLRLIAGELQPEAGTVRVDGQDLARHDHLAARRAIALVPPDPALVAGTLLENLTLDEPGLELPAMELATALGLDSVAAALPGGWHTPVGAGGMPLPRGVIQRIGLVRALACRPRILLLDDVTSQLDADGDARLGRLLAQLRGGVTILLVSHRPSALSRADRVLRIANARLEPAA
ncbi:ATP-binding cassette domain-containing protein [Falsiroseomonas oryzae]|uniref:ATP-binding cassette domain-containing protein n=1 Tax=Falsiroseomonas oryzae TaxID=2766473 RepID=UPI0022EAF208|nr:ABC transporter transmembrane domain-containing protein [Roseomonas sp. MO-31]